MDEAPRALKWFVGGVVVAALAAVAWMLTLPHDFAVLGEEDVLFVVVVIGLFFAELRPFNLLRRKAGNDFTASWTFAFALLLVSPAIVAVGLTVLAAVLSEVLKRKPFIRIAFNAGQLTLSLAAGALVLEVFHKTSTDGSSLGLLWLVGVLGAGAALLLVNAALTCAVVAIYEQRSVRQEFRRNLLTNAGTDGMMLGLAPVLIAAAEANPWVVPILLVTAWAVYRTAVESIAREHEATHDVLTEMPNRRLFEQEAGAAIRELGTTTRLPERANARLAVAVFDLDGFKGINDRLGHHVGDLVLTEVARRLDGSCRTTDVVARFGGDEFVVLLNPVVDERQAMHVLERMKYAIEGREIVADGLPLAIRASVGVTLYPDHGEDLSRLLERADLALYHGKRGGVVQLFADATHRVDARRSLVAELPRALERGELLLHYQPKIELATRRVIGVEALVRWRHPQEGLVMPGMFMPIVEQTELVTALTERVLDLALAEVRAWASVGVDLKVAVNGSARNLHDLAFPDMVSAALRRHNVGADHLELEITENTVLDDPDRTALVLAGLRDLGVALSIDDFGTGYSSLAALRSLPVGEVKIDRSFVSDMLAEPGDLAIVRSIVDLARNLGLQTVAEGVEDEAVLTALADLGCDQAQGYTIARPLPSDDLLPWLASWPPGGGTVEPRNGRPPVRRFPAA